MHFQTVFQKQMCIKESTEMGLHFVLNVWLSQGQIGLVEAVFLWKLAPLLTPKLCTFVCSLQPIEGLKPS